MSCAGSEPFALRVLDDSMLPEFDEGSVIIIEPSQIIEDGCFVVAQVNGEYLLRQLKIIENRWYLTALNEDHATVEISGLEAIRGRVIQRAGRRRADRKFYV